MSADLCSITQRQIFCDGQVVCQQFVHTSCLQENHELEDSDDVDGVPVSELPSMDAGEDFGNLQTSVSLQTEQNNLTPT